MATDATGTPTVNLSIPKYDTNVDAPSGLGFNAAMDVIDGLINTANKLPVKKGGTLIGTRRNLNLIQGSGITLTVTDNSGSDQVDVTVAATGSDPPMGGDLSGTASNAQINADAVGSAEIANGAVGFTELATKVQGAVVNITSDGSGQFTINFGTAFPTACAAVVANAATDSTKPLVVQIVSKSTTGFVGVLTNGGPGFAGAVTGKTVDVHYVALGT